MANHECDNCATSDSELMAVRRIYLTPATRDIEAAEQILDDIERWCISCCTQYPCQPVIE